MPDGRRSEAAALRHEAINILQGVDTAAFIDTARVTAVAKALRLIRQWVPQVAGVRNRHDRTRLYLEPADSAANLFSRHLPKRRRVADDDFSYTTTITRTRVRAIDSLNRVFGVSLAVVETLGDMSELMLEFRRPVDVGFVAKSYQRVPQVGYAHSGFRVGDGSWIKVIPKGESLHFVFGLGGGDCPAGCTRWQFYYVTYHVADSSVTLEHQYPNAKWSEPIFWWDNPTRNSINPYPTIDSLFAGSRDSLWWYRQHAVRVINLLLGPDSVTCCSEQSAEHFAALKQAALARRRDGYAALIERLGDSDRDVAREAHTYLEQLTRQRFPGGRDGAARWRRWLDDTR